MRLFNVLKITTMACVLLSVSACGLFGKKSTTSTERPDYFDAKEGQSIKVYAPNNPLANKVDSALHIPPAQGELTFDPTLVESPKVVP